MSMINDIERVLFSQQELQSKVTELGARITEDYAGKEPIFVGVLKGCFVFMADLMRAVNLPCQIDFMAVSSYGKGTTSSGEVQITKDLSYDIAGRDVIIVEDILDSGVTLNYLIGYLKHRNRLRGAGRVYCGLRSGLCGKIPEPAVHRHIKAGDL